jgi:hypothetical protein
LWAVKTLNLRQTGQLHTGYVVPRCGETFDCFKSDDVVAFLSALAHPSTDDRLSLCKQGSAMADVMTVIEGFCDEGAGR